MGMVELFDPFARARRFDDRFSRARDVAIDLEDGDLFIYGMFAGIFAVGAGIFAAVFTAQDGSSPAWWALALVFGGPVVFALSALSAFAVSILAVFELVLVRLMVWRSRRSADVLPLHAVAEALYLVRPAYSRFAPPFLRYGSRVDAPKAVAASVLAVARATPGGPEMMGLLESLNAGGRITAAKDVSVAEAARVLSALDDERRSLLLALVYIDAVAAGRDRVRSLLHVGRDTLVLAADLAGLAEHEARFCLALVRSSSWQGRAADLLATARVVG